MFFWPLLPLLHCVSASLTWPPSQRVLSMTDWLSPVQHTRHLHTTSLLLILLTPSVRPSKLQMLNWLAFSPLGDLSLCSECQIRKVGPVPRITNLSGRFLPELCQRSIGGLARRQKGREGNWAPQRGSLSQCMHLHFRQILRQIPLVGVVYKSLLHF